MHRRLLAAVEALDEPYRTTVRMRWFDGLPPREIAARLGIAPHIVWTRLSRAHARLRETLQEEQGGRRGMLLLLGGVTGQDIGAAEGTLTVGGDRSRLGEFFGAFDHPLLVRTFTE